MFRENIGENLREIRKKKGRLSVARIVDRINDYGYELSADTYYKWERGTRKPPCDAIPYIAKALGVSEQDIVDDYLKTNACRVKTRAALAGKFRAAMGGRMDGARERLVGLLTGVEEASLRLAMDAIGQRYPDFEAYLQAECGVDQTALARLRELYLE